MTAAADTAALNIIYEKVLVMVINNDEKVVSSKKKILIQLNAGVQKPYPSRENDGAEREAQGVGWDMSCLRKLFLTQRKTVF